MEVATRKESVRTTENFDNRRQNNTRYNNDGNNRYNNNNGANASELTIKDCYVNPGRVLKRIQFASRGNVDRHDKRTSHIYVCVTDGKGVEE